MAPYPEEICGPRGVRVKECCAAVVAALGEDIMDDGFEDGEAGVGVVCRTTIEDEVAAVAAWLTLNHLIIKTYKP